MLCCWSRVPPDERRVPGDGSRGRCWRRCARSSRSTPRMPAAMIYLDGNSLGPLPRATAARVQQVVEDEWGRGLIRSWNTAGWITLSQRDRRQDRAARRRSAWRARRRRLDLGESLQGAGGRACRSCEADAPRAAGHPLRRTNFPTDLYIADTLRARARLPSAARGHGRSGRRDGRRHGGRDADPRELPHRPHARHAGGRRARRTPPARS